MKKQQYRQGDVLIERVSELSKQLAKTTDAADRVILAHGEVTGHAHEIAQPRKASIKECKSAVELLGDLGNAGATMTHHALAVHETADLVHQEHATIVLPKGDYIVRRQREYSPQAIRNVAD